MNKAQKDEIVRTLERGHGIATAQDIPELANIHDIPNAEHLGFGLFVGQVDGIKVEFNAGGAMTRTPEFSWTPVYTTPEGLTGLGIDLDAQLFYVRSIVTEE